MRKFHQPGVPSKMLFRTDCGWTSSARGEGDPFLPGKYKLIAISPSRKIQRALLISKPVGIPSEWLLTWPTLCLITAAVFYLYQKRRKPSELIIVLSFLCTGSMSNYLSWILHDVQENGSISCIYTSSIEPLYLVNFCSPHWNRQRLLDMFFFSLEDKS